MQTIARYKPNEPANKKSKACPGKSSISTDSPQHASVAVDSGLKCFVLCEAAAFFDKNRYPSFIVKTQIASPCMRQELDSNLFGFSKVLIMPVQFYRPLCAKSISMWDHTKAHVRLYA